MGLAFLSIGAFWHLYDNIIPLMLKNTFGLGETLTGFLMGIDNILALVLLPLFGAFSDKVNTPLGKRTPFILFGSAIAVIAMSFIPLADRKADMVMFFVLMGIVLLAMGSYRSPAVALMPDLTPKPLRSKANSVINLMGAVGAIYTLLAIMFLVKEPDENGYTDYSMVFFAVAAIIVVAVVILVITIREKKLAAEIAKEELEEVAAKSLSDIPKSEADSHAELHTEVAENGMPKDVKKSFALILSSIFLWFFAYNAVTTAYSRYAEEVWNMKAGGFVGPLMVATIAAIISYIPIGFFSSKFGRKKTILIGVAMMTASYLCGAFFNEFSIWVFVIFSFTGIGWAAISVNSYPMVVEMCKGADIGKYTGVYYFFSMSAQILTPVVSGALLEFVSYRTLFPYAVVFSFASFCTMWFVKHGDSRPMKKKDVLENFDVED